MGYHITDALATSPEAQIGPFVSVLVHPLLGWGEQCSAQSALISSRPGWPWQDALRVKSNSVCGMVMLLWWVFRHFQAYCGLEMNIYH